MKYLIDNQLPPALVRHLRAHGLDASHVADVGLDRASDRDLWQFSAANGYALVSKDEDFLHLAVADPSGPPFVWVRLGNCRTSALLAAFERSWPRIESCLKADDRIIEIR